MNTELPCYNCLTLVMCRNKFKYDKLNCSILNKWLMEGISKTNGCYGRKCNVLMCRTGISFTISMKTDKAKKYLETGRISNDSM